MAGTLSNDGRPRDFAGCARFRRRSYHERPVNIEGIVAVIGFSLAAYQIVPRWRQLDLSFRFGWLDAVAVTCCIVALLYLQFFPVFAALGLTPKLGFARSQLQGEIS